MTYAQDTAVSVDRSQGEIRTLLKKFGADQIGIAEAGDHAVIGFRFRNRVIRIRLNLPKKDERRFTHTQSRTLARNENAVYAAWEQACRQHRRALALHVKARLVAVEQRIRTVETEFLADTVLADGRTVNEWLEPQLEQACLTGVMPAGLPMLEEKCTS